MLLAFVTACYSPPDLPLIDDIPIVAATGECAPHREDRVVCVLDGDTYAVDSCLPDHGERFRLLGIDAPEVAHEGTAADCFADEAAQELERLLGSALVTVSFDAECLDPFGRSLAYAWLTGDSAREVLDEDRTDDFEFDPEAPYEPAVLVNEWMLAKGFARVFDEEWAPLQDLRFGSRLEDAERTARGRATGLWGACDPEGG